MLDKDRTKHIDEICDELKHSGDNDLRIGQVIQCIIKDDELFYIENDRLLKLLKEFNGS